MTDWNQYVQLKSEEAKAGNQVAGARPRIWEYLWIRIVDNGLIVTIVFLTLIFAGIGMYLDCHNKETSAPLFYDLVKVCLGVLLGLVAEKGKGKGKG